MRCWSNHKSDCGSIHAFGNGRFLVYGQGPEIVQFQGPPYSVPSYGSLTINEIESNVECNSSRLKGENTWKHTLYSGKNMCAVFTDYMDYEYNVFVREFVCDNSITMKLNLHAHTEVYEYEDYNFEATSCSCIMLVMRKGTRYFTDFSSIEEQRMYIITQGNVTYNNQDNTFVFNRGEGRLLFVSSNPGDIIKHASFALSDENIYFRQKSFFNNFLKAGEKINRLISEENPEKDRIKDVLESVAIGIKCQQSFDGGIIAGHYYPMAYVRDQAGTMRGLLQMGYIGEAKAVIDFWYRKWCLFGNLLNAESMGHNNDRLMFSNDEVEIPAYIVFCAFEYLDETGDIEYIKSIYPMLKWAVNVQLPHLGHGMTGFSGDETYIAGGTFPREFIYHGSAESTLLFIEGAKKFIDFAKDMMQESELSNINDSVMNAIKLYKDNFLIDGIIYGNNPIRERYITPPRFHRGFCVVDLIEKRPPPLMWLERQQNGFYACPNCFKRIVANVNEPEKRYLLGSVGLLPVYYHSDMFSHEEIDENVKPFVNIFREKGYLPSNIEGNRSLGYDFGLLLYNLTYINHPLREEALKVMLDMVDGTGMWVEYYDDKKAFNCRCRPWESGINTEALIYYLKDVKKRI